MAIIDLRFTNVNHPLPSFIYKQMESYVAASNRYFHQPEDLRHALAERHNVDPGMISLVAGIDQAILVMSALYGSRTHIFTPTYVGYCDAKRFGTLTEHKSLHEDSYSINSAMLPDATLIFLANPNNPAGTTPGGKIIELVANNPQAKVFIDEAFGDFANDSVAHLAKAHANMIVARSFSKGFALAGMRIGYVIARPELLADLELETTWFNVSNPSIGGALSALSHESHFEKIRAGIVTERNQTATFLIDRGYRVIRGSINAILLRFDNQTLARTFVTTLEEHDILVHQGNGASNMGLDQSFVRLAIGAPEQMAAFRAVVGGL